MTEIDKRILEDCIAWAAQHGYGGATRAAEALSRSTGRVMVEDQPYYHSFAWQDRTA